MATLFRRTRCICQCQRNFSTATPRRVNLQWEKNDPEALADALPAYPYGPTQWYKQSRLGLYGGSRIQFGNNVSDEFETKTRRKWRPNVLTRKLFSKALNRHVQVRVSARVLRTIDKLGGLDEYLLGEKEARIKELGETGWWLRWAVMQTPAVRARFAEQRRELGLPEEKDNVAVVQEAIAAANDAQTLEDGSELNFAANLAESESVAKDARIKFRVGPKKHLFRSSEGWRRSWAQPWMTEEARGHLARKFYPGWVERRMKAVKLALQEYTDGQEEAERPTKAEQEKILASARADLEQELRTIVEQRNEKRLVNQKRRHADHAQRERRKQRAEDTANAVAESKD